MPPKVLEVWTVGVVDGRAFSWSRITNTERPGTNTYRVEDRYPGNPLAQSFVTVFQSGPKSSTNPTTTSVTSADGKLTGARIVQANGAITFVLFNADAGQTPAPLSSMSFAGATTTARYLLGAGARRALRGHDIGGDRLGGPVLGGHAHVNPRRDAGLHAQPLTLVRDRDLSRPSVRVRLIDGHDLAPERHQRDRDQLEVRQPQRDADDRQALDDSGDQVQQREPPAAQQEPDDVPDARGDSGVRPSDHRPAERPQREQRDPQRGDPERDREDQ